MGTHALLSEPPQSRMHSTNTVAEPHISSLDFKHNDLGLF